MNDWQHKWPEVSLQRASVEKYEQFERAYVEACTTLEHAPDSDIAVLTLDLGFTSLAVVRLSSPCMRDKYQLWAGCEAYAKPVYGVLQLLKEHEQQCGCAGCDQVWEHYFQGDMTTEAIITGETLTIVNRRTRHADRSTAQG